MLNRIQVFPISVQSGTKLEHEINDFLDYLHRCDHRVIDIKYQVSHAPLIEGFSQELHSAMVIYEEADKNNLPKEKYAKPEK